MVVSSSIIFHKKMGKKAGEGFVKMYVNDVQTIYNEYNGRTGYGFTEKISINLASIIVEDYFSKKMEIYDFYAW